MEARSDWLAWLVLMKEREATTVRREKNGENKGHLRGSIVKRHEREMT